MLIENKTFHFKRFEGSQSIHIYNGLSKSKESSLYDYMPCHAMPNATLNSGGYLWGFSKYKSNTCVYALLQHQLHNMLFTPHPADTSPAPATPPPEEQHPAPP
jgi:hypothetical protein